jgi:hypothetical protein
MTGESYDIDKSRIAIDKIALTSATFIVGTDPIILHSVKYDDATITPEARYKLMDEMVETQIRNFKTHRWMTIVFLVAALVISISVEGISMTTLLPLLAVGFGFMYFDKKILNRAIRTRQVYRHAFETCWRDREEIFKSWLNKEKLSSISKDELVSKLKTVRPINELFSHYHL